MMRAHWSAPGLIVAAGIIGATAVAVLNVRSGGMAAAAALIVVLSLLAADVLGRRHRKAVPRPSRQAMLLAGAVLLACGILAAVDPASVAMMIPVLGGGAAVPILQGAAGARGTCGASAPGSTS